MADHVAVTEGAGKSIATDDVGGNQYQRVKLDLGTDGAAAPALAGAGAVATGVQRMTLASDDPAVALLTTIDSDTNTIQSDTTAIKTAVELLDNSVDGNYLNVNVNAAGTDLAMNAGVLSAQTQRVTIATDDEVNNLLGTIDADTSTLAGAVAAGQMQVDIVADGAGLATDAKLDTIITAVQILDDWDESDRAKVNLVAGQAGITANAGAVGASTPRVTLASDDPAVALLTTIDSDTNTIQSDTTAIKTAVEIMDDWNATHDSAASADGVQLMAAYDATKPTAVADGDAVRVLSDEYGRLLSGVEKTAWQAVYDSADASAEAEVVKASAASTIIVLQHYTISSDTELWVKLQDEDSTALTGKHWLKAGGGASTTLPLNCPIVLGVDKDLEVIAEGAGDVSVTATGYTIPG